MIDMLNHRLECREWFDKHSRYGHTPLEMSARELLLEALKIIDTLESEMGEDEDE